MNKVNKANMEFIHQPTSSDIALEFGREFDQYELLQYFNEQPLNMESPQFYESSIEIDM